MSHLEQTVSELAVLLDGSVVGNPEVRVRRLAKIEAAGPGAVSFLSNPEYERFIYTTEASVVIVASDFQPAQPLPPDLTLLRVEDPYRAFARLLEAYDAVLKRQEGIHPTAVVDDEASLGEGCFVGPHVVVERGAVIGDRVELHAHVHVGRDVRIGHDSVLHSGVRILDRCVVGQRCTLQAGAIVGSDGFGFAPKEDGSYAKVPQTGNVVIEDNCDIGAMTTVDRATLGSTVIRRGCKLDNLIQVAHNVVIGEATVIAAQTGIAGSTTLGARCMIGGQVGIGGHLTIAKGSKVAAKSGVSASLLKEDQTYQGNPAVPVKQFQKFHIALRRLARIPLGERLDAIEQALEAQNSPSDNPVDHSKG
jgi:UDP-3-O-[3-hydroxymyristoyl] glucosamine N-acyltransferase